MAEFKASKNQLIRGVVPKGQITPGDNFIELKIGKKGLWSWTNKMGIDTTSADDISTQSRKIQALKPQASIEYKNSEGKNISFVGKIQAFEKKGKYYKVRLETFDKLKLKKEPFLLKLAGKSRLKLHNKALKQSSDFSRKESATEIELGLSSYTKKTVNKIFQGSELEDGKSLRTVSLEEDKRSNSGKKNRTLPGIKYTYPIHIKDTGAELQLNFKVTPSVSGEVTYPTDSLWDLLDPEQYSVTAATDIEFLGAAKVVLPFAGGWTEGELVGGEIPLSNRYTIEGPDPITGFGKIRFEPTLRWTAGFSSDSGKLNPWLQYAISKKYGVEVRVRGFDFEAESTTNPMSTEFTASPGILGGCYCDMRAEIVPGMKLSWDIGVNPSWPVIGKMRAFRKATLATLYGTFVNPLGINFAIYDGAASYLSTRGLVGIGVKLLPSIVDIESSESMEIYNARSDNFFA